MIYKLTFELSPAAVFGVPEAGVTVVPAAMENIYSETFTNTAAKIGHGTLSQFRRDDERLALEVDVDEAHVDLRDNFASITLPAETALGAYHAAANVVEAILANLALEIRRPLSHQAVYIVDETGQPYPPPKFTDLMKVTTYNLSALAERVTAAASTASLNNERLNRALHYFEHALLLHDNRNRLARPNSRHYSTTMAAVMLNLWKAVSTIVGEAGTDRDHQRRYREFGIDREFFLNRIERLRELRNDFDVAHYSLSREGVAELERMYGEAVSTTIEVIKKYQAHLARVAEGGAGTEAAELVAPNDQDVKIERSLSGENLQG